MSIRIKSLEELKKWNEDNHPIVFEWFMDWIFDDVLSKKNLELFKEAIHEIVIFAIICEKLSRRDAYLRIEANLMYWEERAGKNNKVLLNKYLDKVKSNYI